MQPSETPSARRLKTGGSGQKRAVFVAAVPVDLDTLNHGASMGCPPPWDVRLHGVATQARARHGYLSSRFRLAHGLGSPSSSMGSGAPWGHARERGIRRCRHGVSSAMGRLGHRVRRPRLALAVPGGHGGAGSFRRERLRRALRRCPPERERERPRCATEYREDRPACRVFLVSVGG